MAYALYTQALGSQYANSPVKITNSSAGVPAVVLASSTGGLLNSNGDAVLDGSGNLSVVIDTAITWTVTPTTKVAFNPNPVVVFTGNYASFPAASKFAPGYIAIAADQANAEYITDGTTWKSGGGISLTTAQTSAGATATVALSPGATATTPTEFFGADGLAPAIIRGTVSGSRWPGLVIGSGQVLATQQTNGTALQAAITAAYNNSKWFELEPGNYEFNLAAGLKIPPSYTAFQWKGEPRNTRLFQSVILCPMLEFQASNVLKISMDQQVQR